MDYNSLVSAVQAWTENDDTEMLTYIPQFVENACRTIAKEVDAIGLNAIVSVTADAGSPFVVLPNDCFVIKSVVKVSAGRKEFLKHRPYDYLVEYWPDYASVGGNPTHYTRLNDSQLYIVPTPTSTQELELRNVTVSIPSSTNVSAYVLDRYPNLLLYRTLFEASMFMKHSDDAQKWQATYDRERDAVENEARRNRRDDGDTPNRINNIQVQNNLKPNQ